MVGSDGEKTVSCNILNSQDEQKSTGSIDVEEVPCSSRRESLREKEVLLKKINMSQNLKNFETSNFKLD